MEAAGMSSVCGDLEGTHEVARNYVAPQISRAARICKERDIDWNERFINVIASLIPIIDLLLKGERKHVWKRVSLRMLTGATGNITLLIGFDGLLLQKLKMLLGGGLCLMSDAGCLIFFGLLLCFPIIR